MRLAIVALRAVVGALFIGHGLQKLAGWSAGTGSRARRPAPATTTS